MKKYLFSIEVKELIKESRKVAIECGNDYISTIHLFLADCRISEKGSLKKFAFQTDQDFQIFFDSVKTKKLNLDILELSLPLTKEAENVIRNSQKERQKYSQNRINNCHLFLAAASDKQSLFISCFPDETELYEKLVKYYSEEGLIAPEILVPKENLFKKLLSIFVRRL